MESPEAKTPNSGTNENVSKPESTVEIKATQDFINRIHGGSNKAEAGVSQGENEAEQEKDAERKKAEEEKAEKLRENIENIGNTSAEKRGAELESTKFAVKTAKEVEALFGVMNMGKNGVPNEEEKEMI